MSFAHQLWRTTPFGRSVATWRWPLVIKHVYEGRGALTNLHLVVWIEALKRTLAAGDDAFATKRITIANWYRDLNDNREAAKWYLEAAKYAAWSENGLSAVAFAKLAAEIAPDNVEVIEAYTKYRSLYIPDDSQAE